MFSDKIIDAAHEPNFVWDCQQTTGTYTAIFETKRTVKGRKLITLDFLNKYLILLMTSSDKRTMFPWESPRKRSGISWWRLRLKRHIVNIRPLNLLCRHCLFNRGPLWSLTQRQEFQVLHLQLTPTNWKWVMTFADVLLIVAQFCRLLPKKFGNALVLTLVIGAQSLVTWDLS